MVCDKDTEIGKGTGKTMERRLDIQGLRGIAVLAVILYHFDIPPAQGGFIGVDIFFVISGFLMTGILVKMVEGGRYSYGGFALRRVRRLFPALLVTSLAVLAAGAIWFAPFELERLAGVVLLAPVGLSNVLFWAEADYFDVSAFHKPLLHTWSLAVEIQFYLVWPFVVLAGLRWGRVWLALCIAVLALVSFGGGLWMLRVDPTGAFYLMPLRGYEFALGGLAFLAGRSVRANAGVLPALLRDALYGLALITLLATVVIYSSTTPFPGWASLQVTGATTLMLWIGPNARLAALISGRVLQLLGDVSYAAYLVHWPVVVFALYFNGGAVTGWETAGLLVLTALLTAALYLLVEEPLRCPDHAIWRRRWRTAGWCVLLAALLPGHALLFGGWPGRTPDGLRALNTLDRAAMEAGLWPEFNRLGSKEGYSDDGRLNVLVIGDSQAADYVNVLAALEVRGDLDVITRPVWTTCNIPYLEDPELGSFLTEQNPFSVKDPGLQESCPAQMKAATSGPAFEDAEAVVLAFAWRDVSLPMMGRGFAQLAARTDAPLYAVGNKTLVASPVDLANQLGTTTGLGAYAYSNIRAWTLPTNAAIAASPDATLIDILSLYCTAAACHMLAEDGRPLMWDETHFTHWGVEFVATRGGASGLAPFLGR